MILLEAAISAGAKIHPLSALGAMLAAARHSNRLLHFLFSFGLLGLFAVSIVDSSFVPLPIPGVTDIMLVLFAAQKMNFVLLIGVSTLGSALGGYLSYQVGHAGGMKFLETHIPPRIFKRVCGWMEQHAVLSIALPALLPPPMPLSPFVLAAGALKMSMRKFLTIFTISRGARHALAVWLGIHYGPHVLRMWARFSAKWATPILILLWSIILVSAGIAFWKMYRTSKSVGLESGAAAG